MKNIKTFEQINTDQKVPDGFKVKIGNTIYDSNVEPIMIIFNSDEQRKTVAGQLASMEDTDGIRKYVQYPTGTDEKDVRIFMKLEDNNEK